MSDTTCHYCKKGVVASAVSCKTCNAKNHKSCAERCRTDVLGVLKCCKNSRSSSPITPANAGLSVPVTNALTTSKGNSSPSGSDISRLSADIKVLSDTIAKGFSNSNATSKLFSEQMNGRMQTIEDKLVLLDTVQVSLGKLTTRLDELEVKVSDPTSCAISCAQEAK